MLMVAQMPRLEEFLDFSGQGLANAREGLEGATVGDSTQRFTQRRERLGCTPIGANAERIISL
jgi:hypothetical protein